MMITTVDTDNNTNPVRRQKGTAPLQPQPSAPVETFCAEDKLAAMRPIVREAYLRSLITRASDYEYLANR